MAKSTHNPTKATQARRKPARENIDAWNATPGDGRRRVIGQPNATLPRKPSMGHVRNMRSDEAAGPILPPQRRRNYKPKSKNKNKKIGRPLLVLLVGFVVIAGVVVWAREDPRWDVRRVSVQGTQTLLPSEIANLVPVPAHHNIFLYYIARHRALAERIQKEEPVVRSADVAIQLPGTLVVTVVERQPYALLREGNGGFWVLDSDGVPFRQVDSWETDLPCITLPPGSVDLELGRPLSLDRSTPVGAFYLALQWLSTPRMAALSKIREITVDQNANLCLNMSNNLQIRLGQPDQLAQKLALAATALSSDSSLLERAQYLDVSYPERPAWKPRSPVVPVAPLPRDNAD